MASEPLTRVVVVDDDSLVRLALRSVLSNVPNLEIVGEASDGGSAFQVLLTAPADVLLMDVRMPSVNGIAALPRIRSQFPALRIILMTAFGAERLAAHAKLAGANGVLRKSASRLEFVDAITGRVLRESDSQPPKSGLGANASPREQEVGRRVAIGQTNEQISEALGLSVNTIKTYVSRLFVKYGVSNRVQLANLLNGMPIGQRAQSNEG